MQKIFTTERLYIRPMRFSDVDDIVELDSDPDVFQSAILNFGTHLIIGKSDKRKIIKGLMRGNNQNNLRWVILSKLDRKFIGCISIESTPNVSPTCITYRIVKSEWNKGIVSEALPIILKYLFSEMKYMSLTAVVDIKNAASQRIVEKNGFQKTGVLNGTLSSSSLVSINKNAPNSFTPKLLTQSNAGTGAYLVYELRSPIQYDI